MIFTILASVLTFIFIVIWFSSNLTAVQIAVIMGFGVLLINTVIFLLSLVLFVFIEPKNNNKNKSD